MDALVKSDFLAKEAPPPAKPLVLWRPTAKTGSVRNSAVPAYAASTWAALALVIKIAAHGPAPIGASATGAMRKSGATITS